MRLVKTLSLGVALAALMAAPLSAHAQAVQTNPAAPDSVHMSNDRDADVIRDQIKSYNALLKAGENGLPVYQNTGAMFTPISPAAQVAAMGAGMNVVGDWSGYWNGTQSDFADEQIKAIADAGFKTIRVPLDAFHHIVDTQGNLDEAYLKRIDHVVDLAIANKLNIILDEHNFNECAKDADGCAVLLSNVWYDLALRYQTAPNNVMFELLNEPNGQIDDKIWNAWLPDLIAQVRQFNPTRNIIVGPTHWNSIDDLSLLQLPADDQHIIVTFHYYQPFKFTHQGADWAGPEVLGLHDVRWAGTAEDLAAIDSDFAKAAAWGKANNRPMFLGEYGTYAKYNPNMDDRANWTRAVSKAADAHGFARAYWFFSGKDGFGAYDTATKQWIQPIKNALVGQ